MCIDIGAAYFFWSEYFIWLTCLTDIFIGKLDPFSRQYLNSSNPNSIHRIWDSKFFSQVKMDKSPQWTWTPWGGPKQMVTKSGHSMSCKMNNIYIYVNVVDIYMSIYVSVFLTYILPTMQLWINVIQFWTSIVSIHNWMTVLSLLLFLLLSSLSFSWCFIFMNAPGLRDPVVMRVLSNFNWRLVHKFSWFCLRHQNMSQLAWLFWGSVSGICLTKVACLYV